MTAIDDGGSAFPMHNVTAISMHGADAMQVGFASYAGYGVRPGGFATITMTVEQSSVTLFFQNVGFSRRIFDAMLDAGVTQADKLEQDQEPATLAG